MEPITTTIKRIQTHSDFYFTVENTNVEVSGDPGDGLTIREITIEPWPFSSFEMSKEVTIALRDALNELYPAE
jgi:hypothetical protein